MKDLEPLRVPEALRRPGGYHVPQPANIRIKLDANELPYPLPAPLRARLAAALAEVALGRRIDVFPHLRIGFPHHQQTTRQARQMWVTEGGLSYCLV